MRSTHQEPTTAPTCTCDHASEATFHLGAESATDATASRGLERMLTMDEVCEILRPPKSTIYSLRSEGRGPVGVRVGRRVLFRPVDIEAFVEANRTDARR